MSLQCQLINQTDIVGFVRRIEQVELFQRKNNWRIVFLPQNASLKMAYPMKEFSISC